ncbi:MAG: glycerol-3-phosphate 1-O-acyltransferase PlsY [Holosporales bacterium]|jgi:glycerol-3-phosphate acyltransferase PlsY|nr:glycerol-3-phosphate 1-O-acyltransferase PlsY [Holosporales bacterium]
MYWFAIFGYLIGSVPFGIIFTRMLNLGDIRAIGSKNIGATNVLRTGNKTAAFLTLLFDMLKGWAPVWLYMHYSSCNDYGNCSGVFFCQHISTNAVVIALLSIFGHVFPIFAKFKGGKGVATTIGTYIALSPFCASVLLGAWGVTLLLSKISSLSALISICIICPIIGAISIFFGGGLSFFVFTLLCGALIAATHYQNIKRLIYGTESRIGH